MAKPDSADHARREVFRTIGMALWRNRGRTALAMVLLVAAKLLMVTVPALLKRIVDALSEPAALLTVPVFLLLGYAAVRFAGSLFTELRDLVFTRVAQSTVADFTVRMFEHMQRLGARFHSSRQTGALARDMERGTAGVGYLLGTALFTLLPTLVEIVTVVVILVLGYSLWFALIVAVTFIAYFSYTYVLTERRAILQRELNELDSRASGRIVDSLLNYEAVKLNANEAIESRRLNGVLDEWIGVGVLNQRSLSRLHIGQSAIIAAGVGLVMLLAGQQVVQMRMTVGDLVLVNAYIIQICLPLNTLGLIFRQAKEALINAERVCELLLVPAESGDGERMPDLRVQGGEITFEHVSFGYEPGRNILWDVSFTVPAGATVAIVGGSGSGKSTVARLLFRFYDPDEGRVLIDGQDLRNVGRASLRRSLGIVPQDTLLFNDTIAYNIAYSRPDADAGQVEEAASGARVHEFIASLPAAYETPVGERGVKLSGGERQRIAIARALLKNPPIMVFDEATSALDTRTERAIQAELDRIAQGRTTMIIAHRLSTIVNADRILVLDHGRIVEQGTHRELLDAGGMYAQMWSLQRQQQELEQAGAVLSRQPVNLAALVAGVLDSVREISDAKGVNVYTAIEREAARITGDPSALQQLIWNLCTHAVAVTPTGGRIALRLHRNGPDAQLTITDGRPPTASAVAYAHIDGVPDGLREAAALDPEEVAAEAQRLGARFEHRREPSGECSDTMSFPLRAVVELPAASSTNAVDLHGISVMLVDDQVEARELVAELLQEYGAAVTAYADGPTVLAELRQRETATWPGVLVSDISLGEMDGYELIRNVRAVEAERGIPLARRLPAIALSGLATPDDRLRALLAGFQGHLGKPADPRELAATVRVMARPPVPTQVPDGPASPGA
ncbi:ATP-binding cassette domain-containing protein [Bordetella genomosp. 13]|uniref:ABC transporter ATP-binding protein n=1 Tax=Bordetella genomosp. 13 TaxID=463040 RepID=A0A1W6Z9Z0_9BORD|nr:ATP-binding cassette domain-containing protein [Bordetella genomosp. 13]ARP94139.1 ABC transporter ATP-binding protein [Bordetella genomosp. 13]